jgi:hypothetical protein
MGLAAILVELYLLLLILASALSSSDPEVGSEGAFAVAVIFSFFLVVEKLITVYHGRRFLREFIPAS